VNNESKRVGRMTVVEHEAMPPHTPEGTRGKNERNIQTNKQKTPEKLVSGLKAAGKLA
jgi:hypothetical protein